MMKFAWHKRALWPHGTLVSLMAALPAHAADSPSTLWPPSTLGAALLTTVIFGALGIVMAIGGFKLFDAVIRYDLEKEICEKNNTAVAILSAGVILGICLIIAAVVHG